MASRRSERIPCHTCNCADACDFAERVAETKRDHEDERDPGGFLADRAAERYERNLP